MSKRERALEAAARVYCAQSGTDSDEAINFPHPVKRLKLAALIVKPIIAAYEAALAEEEPSEAEVEAAAHAIADAWHTPIAAWNKEAGLPEHRRAPWESESKIWLPAARAALRAARKARMG